jgi:hypothetical protein
LSRPLDYKHGLEKNKRISAWKGGREGKFLYFICIFFRWLSLWTRTNFMLLFV